MMKINETEKVVARIDTPKFPSHPLVGVSIGGDGNKWLGYVRGDNFGVLGFFGIYISFRLPYKKNVIFGQGVEEGFKAASKTVAYLVAKINKQSFIITDLLERLEEMESKLNQENEDEDDDDTGFNPQWN